MNNCWSSTSRVPKQGAQKNSDTWPTVTAGVHKKLHGECKKKKSYLAILKREKQLNGPVKDMVLKQRHKTRWNGDKRHKDGLNNNREMAYSSKCERTVFEIQTMEITTLPSPPHLRGTHWIKFGSREQKKIFSMISRVSWKISKIIRTTVYRESAESC